MGMIMKKLSTQDSTTTLPDELKERKELAEQLRVEVDKIRYQWNPPTYMDNDKLRLLISMLRGLA